MADGKAPWDEDYGAETAPWDEDYSAAAPGTKESGINPAESAVRSFADTGSYGFAPRIQGAIGGVKDYLAEGWNNPGEDGDHTLRALGPVEGVKRAYAARFKQAREQYAEAAEANPVS